MTLLNTDEIDFCGIVLAGGKSRRMGQDKSELTLKGQSFLEIQVNKLTSLKAKDIIISGKLSPIKYTHCIMDHVPDCGPLGGLYSCFLESKCKYALILSVDVPLISVATLGALLTAHVNSGLEATILSHGDKIEPLLAVYNTDTTELLKKLIDKRDLSIRSFIKKLNHQMFDFKGDEIELLNCNYPDEYNQIKNM